MNPNTPYPDPLAVPAAPADPASAAAAEDDAMLDDLARAVCTRGLAPAAIFFLESIKPLNFIGSQTLYAASPLASLLFDRDRIERLAGVLEDRGSVERLIARIEKLERQP